MSRLAPNRATRLTRAPYERMNRIHDELQQGRLPNCRSIARTLEVSTKTIQRDIEFMRDRLGLPIEFDAVRNGYRYTEAVDQLPLATITEGELIAMLVAQKAVEQYRGTPFEAPLAQAFAKLTSTLHGPVTIALGAARASITFKQIGSTQAELRMFRKLSEAVLHAVEIEFDYQGLRNDTPERRHVQPWHLCCVNHQWYVIGHDLRRGAKRTFALPRIRSVRLHRRRFVRPVDFSIEKHLGGAFGVFAGTGDHTVRLRFDGWAARLVSERFWHESQKLTEGPVGALDLELRLNSLEEIKPWILSFGGNVEVMAPRDLRASVAEAGRQLARRNSNRRRRNGSAR